MRRFAATFLLVLIAWIALTFSLEPLDIVVGIALSLVISFISRHLLSRDTPRIVLHPVRWAWIIVYMAVMIYVEVRAHLDVITRVFTGRIRPAMVKVPVEFKSQLGKTLLGNSITLTPGTLTVDARDDRNFYVHTLAYRRDMDIGKIFRKFGIKVIS
jgi:multicomponent Na+:H+ antiporter subunit E